MLIESNARGSNDSGFVSKSCVCQGWEINSVKFQGPSTSVKFVVAQ